MAKSDQAGTRAMCRYIDHYVDDDYAWEGKRPPMRQVQCSGGRYQLECKHYVRGGRYEGKWNDLVPKVGVRSMHTYMENLCPRGHEPVLPDCWVCMLKAKIWCWWKDRKVERQNKRKASTEKKALTVKQTIATGLVATLAAGLILHVVEYFDLVERLLTALPE